jgi:hypothetical protein
MSRQKAAIPVKTPFSTRTTAGERAAIDEMIRRWAAERGPVGAEGLTTWFRTVVREMAKAQGIEVVDEAPPPPKPVKRAAKKRAL